MTNSRNCLSERVVQYGPVDRRVQWNDARRSSISPSHPSISLPAFAFPFISCHSHPQQRNVPYLWTSSRTPSLLHVVSYATHSNVLYIDS